MAGRKGVCWLRARTRLCLAPGKGGEEGQSLLSCSAGPLPGAHPTPPDPSGSQAGAGAALQSPGPRPGAPSALLMWPGAKLASGKWVVRSGGRCSVGRLPVSRPSLSPPTLASLRLPPPRYWQTDTWRVLDDLQGPAAGTHHRSRALRRTRPRWRLDPVPSPEGFGTDRVSLQSRLLGAPAWAGNRGRPPPPRQPAWLPRFKINTPILPSSTLGLSREQRPTRHGP